MRRLTFWLAITGAAAAILLGAYGIRAGLTQQHPERGVPATTTLLILPGGKSCSATPI